MLIPNFPGYLTDLHHEWHYLPVPGGVDPHPNLPKRIHPMGTPGGGLEFLRFHHSFMVQAFAWFATQTFNPQLDVTPWTSIPDELKKTELGWTVFHQQEEDRITSNNPRFASSDDLGNYIEVGIHNTWIHGATATHFHEEVVRTLHSPQSTYFYKIHGLVDYWWNRWRFLSAPIRPWDALIKDEPRLLHSDRPWDALIKDEPRLLHSDGFIIAELTERIEGLELQVAMNEAVLSGAFTSSQEWPKVDTEVAKDKKTEESKGSYPRKH